MIGQKIIIKNQKQNKVEGTVLSIFYLAFFVWTLYCYIYQHHDISLQEKNYDYNSAIWP